MFQDDGSHLAHLVRFCFVAISLKIGFLLNAFFSEQVMPAAYVLFKSQVFQEHTQIVERNVGIGCSPQDAQEQFVEFAHNSPQNLV